MDQREELLNRAKDRLKNLKKVELKSETAIKEPTVASRYPRKSMAANANIQTPQIREMNSPSAALENNSSVLNTAAGSSPRKRGTRFLSIKEMNNTRQKLQKLNSISYMLERNVSLANPDPYDQLPVFISPAAEPENVRRRRGLLDRLSKPVDDKPLIEKDIKDIQEMNELYGTNSLQTLRKWECSWESQNQSYNYTFCFPVIGAPEPRVRWTETSPSDGFFVGERPVISKFNYQRLLQRLQVTDSSGNWFIGPRELEIAPDPLNYVHYRNTAALTYNSNYNTIHPEAEGNDTNISIGKGQYREIQLVRKLPHYASHLEKPKLSTPYLLIIEICSIVFKTHPLLHLELDLCNKLTGYLESLNTRKQNALVWYLQKKIWATRVDIAERYAKLIELYAAQPDIADKNEAIDVVARRRLTLHKTNQLDHVQQLEFDLVQSLKELNQLRQLRDAEAQTDLMLEFNVVKTWESIKQLRQSQGYQSTGHKLTIRINAPSNPIDLKKELTDEIEELEMQLYIENQIEARQYRQVIDDYNLNDAISAMDTGSDQKQAKKSRPLEPDLLALDIEQVSAEIKKRHKKSFGSSKQQSLSFKWENRLETITPDLKCPDVT